MDAAPLQISSSDAGSALGLRVAFHIAGAVPEAVFDYVSDPQTVPV